ncbi:hypothetical protein B0H14DRAFT_2585774 [Mycena olivaceomarginata]|nr:hypothetical protein B0H14DRAFT_2585774 [Mycena olivaceomarginata]
MCCACLPDTTPFVQFDAAQRLNLPVLTTPPLMASPTTHCLVLQDQVPSSEETVSYSNDNTRAQILNNVNAVWDDGLFITFGLLPNVITVYPQWKLQPLQLGFSLVQGSAPQDLSVSCFLTMACARAYIAGVPEGKKFSERFPPQLRLPDLHLAEQCDSFETTGSHYAAQERRGVRFTSSDARELTQECYSV